MLKDKNILTKAEFDLKRNEVIKQKLLFEFKLSEEYKSLELLRLQGILSDNEFEHKINSYINSKF